MKYKRFQQVFQSRTTLGPLLRNDRISTMNTQAKTISTKSQVQCQVNITVQSLGNTANIKSEDYSSVAFKTHDDLALLHNESLGLLHSPS